ncbi:MAG TPA: hypothetical protein VJJ24_00165 [Candidatus Paceibacterota bacterium]
MNKDQQTGSQNPFSTKEEMMGLFEEEAARLLESTLADDKKQELEKALTKVREMLNREHIFRELQKQPDIFIDFLHEHDRGWECWDDENWVKNLVMRINEKRKNWEEVRHRIAEDPVATDEEFSAGVYKEALEQQVRSAVFEFRRKGYNTIESGFKPGKISQSISFEEVPGFALPPAIEAYLSPLGITVELKHYSNPAFHADRDIILLTLVDRVPTLEEWKSIWDEVARLMPDQGRSARYGLTGAGKGFRKKQKILRERA